MLVTNIGEKILSQEEEQDMQSFFKKALRAFRDGLDTKSDTRLQELRTGIKTWINRVKSAPLANRLGLEHTVQVMKRLCCFVREMMNFRANKQQTLAA